MLLAGQASGIDAFDFQFLIRRQRWDELTLSRVRIESPAVITALQLPAIEPAA